MTEPRVRVCLPVPLYHCFGSVLGGLCVATHGITLVFPSAGFSGRANLQAIQDHKDHGRGPVSSRDHEET
ncbi:hypothetical protein CRUP_014219 [Coryphaenoides rupestris]|nr:hypothetical protein CRUP_014219 [Coryphaenoides rupestris]